MSKFSAPEAALTDLRSYIQALSKGTAIAVDPHSQALTTQATHLDWTVWTPPFDPHPVAQPARYAYVQATLEQLPAEQGRALLASLRDQYAEVVQVLLPLTTQTAWTLDEMLSLGFRSLKRYPSAEDWRLFHFDLYDYKKTPDWFNPSNWANPERWDKDWW